MQGVEESLKKEKEYLERIIGVTERRLINVPEGHLRISKDKNQTRYYHCKENKIEEYISQKDIDLPKKLAQKTYDQEILKKAQHRYKQIKRILKDYSDDEIERPYLSMNKERKKLVSPVTPIWEQQLNTWLAQNYQGKEFQQGTPVIMTERGERVRSKSEKILADYFYKNDIPYFYEKPLYLKGYGVVYPDFTFYSKKTRREKYWEHEGRMDAPDYAKKAVKKLNLYQMNGIYVGEQLIVTYETEEDVLSTQLVRELVEKYLVE